MAIIVNIVLVTIAIVSGYHAKANDFEPVVPEECLEQGYCTSVSNYPLEHVKGLIKKLQEEGRWKEKIPKISPPSITQRFALGSAGVGGGKMELCVTNEELLYPTAASDENGVWFFVLNIATAKQGFKVEICREKDAPCSPIAVIKEGYYGQCTQEHIYETMHAVGRDGKAVSKKLKLPSSCACTLKPDQVNYV